MRIWTPFPDLVSEIEGLDPAFEVDVFMGEADPPPSVAEVEFYVLPYAFSIPDLELIARMPALRTVQTLTAGYEHVLAYIPAEVTLCNARGVHDASTAEVALTLMLASLRGIPEFVLAGREGRWLHSGRPALADKTVLILGYGSIGAAIERRVLPFETHVVRVARRARQADDGNGNGVDVHGIDELPALLPSADVVVVVTPLTAATRGMVGRDFLALMRPGALLVNVARGPIVDTEALVEALERGHVRAALDVTDPEPLPPDHPLWRTPNTLISPHVGGNTSAFTPRAKRLVLEQLARLAEGRPLANVVAGPGLNSPPLGVVAR